MENELNETTALDYFSNSHFYESECINETEKDISK